MSSNVNNNLVPVKESVSNELQEIRKARSSTNSKNLDSIEKITKSDLKKKIENSVKAAKGKKCCLGLEQIRRILKKSKSISNSAINYSEANRLVEEEILKNTSKVSTDELLNDEQIAEYIDKIFQFLDEEDQKTI